MAVTLVYRTDDGKVFDLREQANEHDLCERIKKEVKTEVLGILEAYSKERTYAFLQDPQNDYLVDVFVDLLVCTDLAAAIVPILKSNKIC